MEPLTGLLGVPGLLTGGLYFEQYMWGVISSLWCWEPDLWLGLECLFNEQLLRPCRVGFTNERVAVSLCLLVFVYYFLNPQHLAHLLPDTTFYLSRVRVHLWIISAVCRHPITSVLTSKSGRLAALYLHEKGLWNTSWSASISGNRCK